MCKCIKTFNIETLVLLWPFVAILTRSVLHGHFLKLWLCFWEVVKLDNRCLLYSAGDAPAAFFDAEGRSELSAQSEEPQNFQCLNRNFLENQGWCQYMSVVLEEIGCNLGFVNLEANDQITKSPNPTGSGKRLISERGNQLILERGT